MMTPGLAKSRRELFYLPYPKQNKVLINAHNFTPATFNPSVNGKTPFAAWIPSRDTVGNGSTTLTDLVGTNNGTLTNMDAATDWVADTGSGGVTALDFDEVNDRVLFGDVTASQWSFGCWFYMRSLNVGYPRLWAQAAFRIEIGIDPSGRVAVFDGSAWRIFGSAITLNTWLHVVITFDGTSLRAYLNGSQIGSTITAGRSMTGIGYMGGASNGQSQDQFDGRIDDTRVWSEALTLSDVAAWNTALRGGQA